MSMVLWALLMEKCVIIGYEEKIHMKVGYKKHFCTKVADLVQPLIYIYIGLVANPIAKSYGRRRYKV